jgi:ABC-type nitrate/sulfonate/bicarbonate transport system permease component
MNFRSAFIPNTHEKSWGTTTFPWLLLCAVVLAVWIGADSKIIPSPVGILAALPSLWFEDGLGQELMTSVSLNFEAAALMIVVSLIVAYGTRMPAGRPVAVVFSAGRFNSFVGLPLVLTLAIGNAHAIKVVLLAIAMSVFTVPAIVDIIGTIPKENYEDGKVLHMSEWRIVWEVVILGKFHEAIDVIRTSVAMGWMMLPMVEGLFRSEGGIGVLLLQENKYLRLDSVYCIIFVVGLMGLAQDRFILELKRWLCPYSFLETEA